MSVALGPVTDFLDLSRGSVAMEFNAAGDLVTYGPNELRFAHDPVTGQALGARLEGAATNYAIRSADFDTARTKVGLTINPNSAVAPDGSSSATRLVETAASGSQRYVRLNAIAVQEGKQFTSSVFVRPDANRKGITLYPYKTANSAHGSVVDFNLETMTAVPSGSFGTAEIVPLADDWFRLAVALDLPDPATELRFAIYFSNDPSNGNAIYDGDGVSGIAVWGAQVEAGSLATTYIPTTTSANQRLADSLPLDRAGTPTGTISLHARTAPGAHGIQPLAQWDNGGDTQFYAFRDSARILRVLSAKSQPGSFIDISEIALGVVADNTDIDLTFGWDAVSFVGQLNGGPFIPASHVYSITDDAMDPMPEFSSAWFGTLVSVKLLREKVI